MYEELLVYVEHIGGGIVKAVMSKQTSQYCSENFVNLQKSAKPNTLSAVALSVNQETNKMGTLPHGISEVAISTNRKSTKLKLYHMATLDLLFCNSKTGTSSCDISGVVVLVNQHIAKNFLIHA